MEQQSYVEINNFQEYSEVLFFLHGEEDYECGMFNHSYAIPTTKWDMVEVKYDNNFNILGFKHYNDFGQPEKFENIAQVRKYVYENWEEDLDELDKVFEEFELKLIAR